MSEQSQVDNHELANVFVYHKLSELYCAYYFLRLHGALPEVEPERWDGFVKNMQKLYQNQLIQLSERINDCFDALKNLDDKINGQ